MVIDQNYFRHNHDGVNSERLTGDSLAGAPQQALTAASSGLSSGGVGSLSSSDNAILNNMMTRINELETRLRNLGLLQ